MGEYLSRTMQILRCWLYARLSRDEDKELNSLNNQMAILRDFAGTHNHIIAGESTDDNVSGMTFEREGLDKLVEAVEAGLVDAVLVKDLSRLGRNRLQSAIFMEYLAEKGVRVLSVTEGIDSFNEEDDLLIGVKQLTNDLYAKDISKKIRYGYRQKQKEGLVIVPPFGYFKDKNTKQVVIWSESAEIVKLMFDLYLKGMGDKKITQELTERKCKSPSQMQFELLGKVHGRSSTKVGKQYMWNEKTVKRILTDEQYTGTLICHKTSRQKIGSANKQVPTEDQIRHEDMLPVIIPIDKWRRVQTERKRRDANNVHGRHGNKLVNRYAGLLKCEDCGASFTALHRKWKEAERIEYVCSNYHRIGQIACTQHRIREEVLDTLLLKELRRIKRVAKKNWASAQNLIDQYLENIEVTSKVVEGLEQQAEVLRDDNRNLTKQISKARDDGIIDILSEQMSENLQQIEALTERAAQIKVSGVSFDKKLKALKTSIELLDEILENGPIGNASLRDIVCKINVRQAEHGEVDLEFILNAPFQDHVELYNQFSVIKKMDMEDPKVVAAGLESVLQKLNA